MNEGKEPLRLVEDLIYYYRDVLVYRQAPEAAELLERVQATTEWAERTEHYDERALLLAIDRLSRAQQEMKWTHHPRIFLEVAMVQVSQDAVQFSAPRAAQGTSRGEANPEANPPEDAGTSPVETNAVQTLQRKVAELEKQMNGLATAAKAASAGQGGPSGAQQDMSDSVSRKEGSPGRFAAGGNMLSYPKLKGILRQASKAHLVQLQRQWTDILDAVKAQQIMVHAWLRDAEPVACGDDFFLLAFQTEIHREADVRGHAAREVGRRAGTTLDHAIDVESQPFEIGDDKLALPPECRGVVLLVADGARRVAVIVEPAHPARISPLLMSAYGLTEREQEILTIFAERAGETIPRHELVGGDAEVGERTIDVQINRLRRKIERDPSNPVWLQTVRGVGYRLSVE
jgi:hypothetical protein